MTSPNNQDKLIKIDINNDEIDSEDGNQLHYAGNQAHQERLDTESSEENRV